MSKKLLGDRQVGDQEYHGGTVMTDEEAAATGLPDADFQDVAESAAPAPEQATPEAKSDADAIVDATADQKNEQQSSAGNDGGAGAAGNTEQVETVEHTLTEEDFVAHPELAEAGHKVGDTIRVPKPTE